LILLDRRYCDCPLHIACPNGKLKLNRGLI
jgi:hypothetical protein